jgi:methyl-accepting chemotaxis protein
MLNKVGISVRIHGMVLGLLAVVTVVAGVGLWKMNEIGGEITEIAEEDIPLTAMVSRIAIHQLEQAVLLEKGLGGLAHRDDAALRRSFAGLGERVATEILEAERLLSDAQGLALTAGAREEFARLATVMKAVEREHRAYEALGEAAFAALIEGRTDEAARKVTEAEALQDRLVTELTTARAELTRFTQEAVDRAKADEDSGQTLLIAATLGGMVFGASMAWVVSRSITKPVAALTRDMTLLAGDHTDMDIPYVGHGDEIGAMARSVEVFRLNAIEVRRLTEERGALEQRAREERRALLRGVAEDIDAQVGAMARRMSETSHQVRDAAETLGANAGQAADRSNAVAQAAVETSANVQTVATAAEELSVSVVEISRQVALSTDITNRAVDQVELTNARVEGLNGAADRIGEVVAMITEIAARTNMLALNATIEAARAGEAGKGFAVVAHEVSDLAKKTARATEDIARQVESVRLATGEAVEAIGGIGVIVREINGAANSIAAAVEEQGAATQEIARNVQQAAAGTEEVTASIGTVADLSQDTGHRAVDLLSNARDMGADSDSLATSVLDLVERIRAAA